MRPIASHHVSAENSQRALHQTGSSAVPGYRSVSSRMAMAGVFVFVIWSFVALSGRQSMAQEQSRDSSRADVQQDVSGTQDERQDDKGDAQDANDAKNAAQDTQAAQDAEAQKQDQDEAQDESDAGDDQSDESDESEEAEEHTASATDFLRVRRDGDGNPVALETSVTRYQGKNEKGEEITVDLIGVVHIGEGDYYADLNRMFEQYDALLYELVAPEGTRIPEGGVREEGFNPISGLQTMMQDVLELEFQLEKIDYNRANFVHADMSPEEFAESMQNNDESFAKMFLKMLGQAMARQGSAGGTSDISLLMAYLSDDRAMRMRRIMAEQMRDIDMAMTMFEGEDGSTIITHRNKKALTILKREIENGHRSLAIFYGAGHLADMEERLINEFEMERGEKKWMIAWKLVDVVPPAEEPAQTDETDTAPDAADGADAADGDNSDGGSNDGGSNDGGSNDGGSGDGGSGANGNAGQALCTTSHR